MRRKQAGDNVDRFRLVSARREIASLRADCDRWAEDNRAVVEAVYELDEEGLPFLSDRAEELWLPLFIVCQLTSCERVEELKEIACRLANARHADEAGDLGIRLLTDIRDIFMEKPAQQITTAELLVRLNGLDSAPWRDHDYGKGLHARALGKLLYPFSIYPRNIRISGKVTKGYVVGEFQDAFDRYLPRTCATPLHNP